jgi:hypothetical protein
MVIEEDHPVLIIAASIFLAAAERAQHVFNCVPIHPTPAP